MRIRFPAIVAMSLSALFVMCGNECTSSSSNQVSQSGAKQATLAKVPLNSAGRTCEQENIVGRIKVTTDPTKVMWIHLVALDGKIIQRMPVRNKVTSGSKRLEPKTAVAFGYGNGTEGRYPTYNGYCTPELIGPDGTYGDSDNYIFWFDPMGRYHQYGTAGGIGYLLTDYPINISNPTEEISGLYNADKAAAEWQQREEQKLRTNESQSVP